MGYMRILNPLQTVVPACGQVQFYGQGDVEERRSHRLFIGLVSVRSVLLVMRFGKYPLVGLDDLSQRQADTEVGLT